MWNKESNCLFDYETNDYSVSEINTEEEGFLVTNDDNDLMICSSIYDQQEDEKYFCMIKKKDNNFVLNFDMKNYLKIEDLECIYDETWISVRHSKTTKNNLFKIKKNNIIKLGKVTFRVRDIVINENKELLKKENDICKFKSQVNNASSSNIVNLINEGNSPQSNEYSNIYNSNFNYYIKESHNYPFANENNKKPCSVKKTNNICRICLSDEWEDSNQLISPCKCSGTMKYIHVQCLKNWMKSKLNIKIFKHSIFSDFYSLECELCKTLMPEKIKIKEKVHDLIDLDRPKSNHIFLESTNNDISEKRFCYLIDMKNATELSLVLFINIKGRALDVDVRMTDISISRYHSKISLIDGEFYIQDFSSKYGTLIQTLNEIILIPNKKVSFQFGKYLISFKVKKTFCSLFRCFSSKSDYRDYNECLYELNEDEDIKECGYLNTNASKQEKEVTDKNTYSNIVMTECISEYQTNKKGKLMLKRSITNDLEENENNLLSSKRGLIHPINPIEYHIVKINKKSLINIDQISKEIENQISLGKDSMEIGSEYHSMEKQNIYENNLNHFVIGNTKTILRSIKKSTFEEQNNNDLVKEEDTSSFLHKKKHSMNLPRFSFKAIDESQNMLEVRTKTNNENKFPHTICNHKLYHSNSFNSYMNKIDIFECDSVKNLDGKQ